MNWIDDYLKYNQDSESPEQYLIWAAVSALAGAMQRKMSLKWGFDTIYPNLYVLLVGPPGRTRKGTAVKPAIKMFTDAGIQLCAASITRARFIRRLRESSDTFIDFATGIAEQHASLTVFAQEFVVFLGSDEQFMKDLTDLYDCSDNWAYETKNAGVDFICGVFVNISGCTTPDLIRSSLPSTMIGSGLASRIIFVCETAMRKKQVFPFYAETPEGKALYDKLVARLMDIKIASGVFFPDDSFMQAYEDYYISQPTMCPFDARRFDAYWSRRATHLRKLSMIFNVARGDEGMILTADDFNAAYTLLTRTEKNMPYVFAGLGNSKDAEVLQPIMTEIMRRGNIEYTELLRLFLRDVSDWELQKIVETLVKIKFCTITKNSNGKFTIHFLEQRMV